MDVRFCCTFKAFLNDFAEIYILIILLANRVFYKYLGAVESVQNF